MPHRAPCLVINLDRRPDRWQDFIARNGHLPLAFERVSGIDGQKLDFAALIAAGFIPGHAPHRQYTPGSVGIALTFRDLWEKIAAGGEPVLVLEDDVRLSPAIIDHMALAHDYLSRDLCDLFYLGYNFNTPVALETHQGFKALVKLGEQATTSHSFNEVFSKRSAEKQDTMIARIMHAWGMCAMMVSPAGAQKLLAECLPLPDETEQLFLFGQERHIPPVGIDSMVNLRLQQMRLRALGVFPPSAITPNDPADSDTVARAGA